MNITEIMKIKTKSNKRSCWQNALVGYDMQFGIKKVSVNGVGIWWGWRKNGGIVRIKFLAFYK